MMLTRIGGADMRVVFDPVASVWRVLQTSPTMGGAVQLGAKFSAS